MPALAPSSAEEEKTEPLLLSSSAQPKPATVRPSPTDLYTSLEHTPPYTLPLPALLSLLHTSPTSGLSPALASSLLSLHGPNRGPPPATLSFWSVFLEEVREPLIVVLLVLGVLYFVWGQLEEAVVVCCIIGLCVLIEVAVEWRAKRALLSLVSSSYHPDVLVTRGGSMQRVPPHDVVPGDLIHVAAGEQIVADGRVVESTWLAVDESALTGESIATHKAPSPSLPADTPLHSRTCMLYADTVVTQGQASFVVTATASHTYTNSLRAITRRTRPPPTPLQVALKRLSIRLTAVAVLVSLGLFLLSLYQGIGLSLAVLSTLSLLFATVPEELPILIKLVLAIGGLRMGRIGVMVKGLRVVESLGGVGVVLTDKTGTLTEGKLTVKECWVKGGGDGSAMGTTLLDGWVRSSPTVASQVKWVSEKGGAEVDASGVRDQFDRAVLLAGSTGTPTVSSSSSLCLTLHPAFARLLASTSAEDVTHLLPFDPYRKRSSCVRASSSTSSEAVVTTLHCRGSPDSLLASCTHILSASPTSSPLTDDERTALLGHVDSMAAKGIRTLAFASRVLPEPVTAEGDSLKALESDMTFIGLVGFEDRLRDGVREAIAGMQRAGITVKMITGDHRKTGEAIARDVGILSPSSSPSLTATSADSLEPLCYCRMTPDDKLSLVRAHQESGLLVLVTGDGFNDSPALSLADVSLAMGSTGTDMARQAASMILTRDEFGATLSAVVEGRRLLSNLKKAIRFYLACKLTLCALFVLAVGGWRVLPLSPMHVIVLEGWMDLGASGAWVGEGEEDGVEERGWEEWGRGRLMQGAGMWGVVCGGGGAMAVVVGGVFWWGWRGEVAEADREGRERVVQSAVLLSWLVSHVLLAHAVRTFRRSIIFDALLSAVLHPPMPTEHVRLEEGGVTRKRSGLTMWGNAFLTVWTVGAMAFGVLVVTVPRLRTMFEVGDVSSVVGGWPMWVPAVTWPFAAFACVELVKFVYSKRLP